MLAMRFMLDNYVRWARRCHVRYVIVIAVALLTLCKSCASFSLSTTTRLIATSTRTSGVHVHERNINHRRSILKFESNEAGVGADSSKSDEQSATVFSKLASNLRTAASDGFGTRARNIGSTMVIGDVVVPLCSNLEKRQSLAQIGLYAGVEYIICEIEEGSGDEMGERVPSERVATLKPAYPLRPHLERSDWPISLPVSHVPLWLSKATYEAGTALGTIILAGTYLVIASILAAFLRVVVVPSESMEPALMPGDVVLVTRSIFTKPKANDVVFFNPPPELDVAIANSKIGREFALSSASSTDSTPVSIVSTKGKQFLKRVVGVPGDTVGVANSNPYVVLECDDSNTVCTYRVDRTGAYSRPDIFPEESWNRQKPTIHIGGAFKSNADKSNTLASDHFFVAGDNGYRSVDSRVWGPLQSKYIFGTANWVVYPMRHFGPIHPGPFSTETGVPGRTTDDNI